MDELQRQLTPQELELLRERLQSLDGQVVAAAVFGSAARGELQASSDIDVLVIAGGLSMIEVQAHFKPTGRLLGRPINVVLFAPDAWRNACRTGNPFPRNILARPLIPLVGQLSTLENKFSEGHEVYLLPPNPGPLGSLEQWIAWRDELLALGKDTPGVDVELAVAEVAISDLKACIPSGAQRTKSVECSKAPDLKSQHITPADGNVFVDLGFSPLEAAALLAEADARIALEKNW